MATPAGIQVNKEWEEMKDPNRGTVVAEKGIGATNAFAEKGIGQTRAFAEKASNAAGALGIGSMPKAAPDNVVVKPVTQVDKTVAEPIKPIQQVFTSPTPPPPEDEEAKAAAAARAQGLAMKKKADEASNKFTRSAIDRGVGTAGQGVTTVQDQVTMPPDRKVDFKEQEKILKQQVEQQTQEAERQGAIEQKNIVNAFAHLSSQGKDSGFINSRNLAAARSANRGVRDAKFQINTEFQKNMFDIAGKKAQQEADFNKEAYVNWISNANDQINAFADAGDYESASQMAAAYAEVDDNNVFKKWSNTKYVDLMQKSFDANNMASFNEIRQNTMSIALNSALEGINMKQSKDAILASLAQNELGEKELIDWEAFVDPSEWDGLGISSENKDILEAYRDGSLDIDSPAVKDAIVDMYIRDMQEERKQEELASRTADIGATLSNNPIGSSLYEAFINDTAGSIDWEPTEGFDVDRFSVFGRDVDITNNPEQLEFVPGIDVLIRDVDNIAYTDQYTPEMGRSKEVEGLPENAGYYTDIYRDYISGKTKEYERLQDGSVEKANFQVNNFDDFLNDIRDAGAGTKEEITAAIEDPLAEGKVGDIRISDLAVDPRQMLGKTQKDYIEILESNNINDLSLNIGKVGQILDEGAKSTDTSTSSIVQDLIEQDKLSEIDAITDSVTGRDNLITDESHALYGENMEDILKTLDSKNEGFVAIGGDMYKVKASAGRDKQSGSRKTYHPVVLWELTPIGGGETISARSRFSEDTSESVSSDITDGRFLEKNSSRAQQHAQSAIDYLKKQSLPKNSKYITGHNAK